MAIVGRWTGADAEALRTAYRMTGEAFAETLGVAVRSVREWKKDPGKVPEMVNQEALDTLLARAHEELLEREFQAAERRAIRLQGADDADRFFTEGATATLRWAWKGVGDPPLRHAVNR